MRKFASRFQFQWSNQAIRYVPRFERRSLSYDRPNRCPRTIELAAFGWHARPPRAPGNRPASWRPTPQVPHSIDNVEAMRRSDRALNSTITQLIDSAYLSAVSPRGRLSSAVIAALPSRSWLVFRMEYRDPHCERPMLR